MQNAFRCYTTGAHSELVALQQIIAQRILSDALEIEFKGKQAITSPILLFRNLKIHRENARLAELIATEVESN